MRLPLLAMFLAAAAAGQPPRQTRQSYEAIPARFGIPADPATLNQWIEHLNVREMRRHAWQIFAGLTAASHDRREDSEGRLPIWETWYSKDETLQAPQAVPRPAVPRFHFPPEELARPVQSYQAAVVSVASRVLFNREARDHIQSHCLYLAAKLDCLLHASLGTGADGQPLPREIPDFPPRSVTLKTSWMHVSQSKCTRIPVWDGIPLFPPQLSNPPNAWERGVWVYPPGVPPDSCPQGSRVPLRDFYHLKIVSSGEVAMWQSAGNVAVDTSSGPIVTGDYVILVAFHAATRELPNWVWTTFWWHDRPNEGPYAADRPSSVRGVWRHYLMDAAYDMDRPWEHDTAPKVAFNPYLEGALTEGTRSNCMTCHRRAVIPNKPNLMTAYSPDPVQQNQIVVRGSAAATATYLPDYDDRLKLHFVWSLEDAIQTPAGTLPAGCGCGTR